MGDYLKANVDLLFDKGSGYIRNYKGRTIRFLEDSYLNVVKDYFYDNGEFSYLVERGLNDVDSFGCLIPHGGELFLIPELDGDDKRCLSSGYSIFWISNDDYKLITTDFDKKEFI